MAEMNHLAGRPDWLPEGISPDIPNIARMYDYYLGGFHNFPVDRMFVDRVAQVYPDVRPAAVANRNFIRRAIHFLMEQQQINQFLDIGSGIPTVGNVHEIAQAVDPDTRVMYVDIDPVAVAISQRLLQDNTLAAAIQGDANFPEQIISHPEVIKLLDFSRPIAVIMAAVLHFIPDDEKACAITRYFHHAVCPGSFLVIAHGTYENAPQEVLDQLHILSAGAKTTNYTHRTRARLLPLFEGFELVEPGLVDAPLWRPDGPDDIFFDQPSRALNLVGVGMKQPA